MLIKNNKSLVTSNNVLFKDNILFYYKIGQTNKLYDRVARKENELQVKASLILNSASKSKYLNKVLAFIRNVAY